MEISPDNIIFWQRGPIVLNATLVFTWGVMVLMCVGSWAVTRRLSTGTGTGRWQSLLEVLVEGTRNQIREISRQDPGRYLAFVGTLFLFISVSNLLTIVPAYQPPTGSLSTSAGLALCVFIAVHVYGITRKGLRDHLGHYVRPTVFMLPFNVLGEISRTIALAVRLFGNVMSTAMIVAILLGIAPLIFPIVMNVLGLLTGLIQAYIFAVLAMVYVASATRVYEEGEREAAGEQKGEETNG